MTEKMVKANGIDICTETFGDPGDVPILLVMGAGGSMLHWEVGFINKLVAGGRFVVRYDQRDTGKTTSIEFEKQPYRFGDMAADAVGVLDAYGINSAHVVGTSMGGMIAQLLALDHSKRVRSITVLMSTPDHLGLLASITGQGEAGELPGPSQVVLDDMAAHGDLDPTDAEAVLDALVGTLKMGYGSAHPLDEARARQLFKEDMLRANDYTKTGNHGLASAATPSWKDRLGTVDVPTLVIHGTEDPLLAIEHGKAIASLIPRARLLVQEGVGHAIPEGEWQRLSTAILEHTAQEPA